LINWLVSQLVRQREWRERKRIEKGDRESERQHAERQRSEK